MREIKFEYIVTMESGEVKKTILTLDQIEQGIMSIGVLFTKKIVRRQFAGLKDKNGAEIYEGDIIENDFSNLFLIDYRYGALCVIHAPSCRAEAEGECKFDYLYDFMKFYNIEVIGNIYENQELLENK